MQPGRRPRSTAALDASGHSRTGTRIHEFALANSTLLRDPGGLMLRTPDRVITKFEPSIVESDPRSAVQAALSESAARRPPPLRGFEKNDHAKNPATRPG